MRHTDLLKPLVALTALFVSMGANENCDPNTLPGDPGSGSVDGAPAHTWTWVEVDGAVCADGSATGMGINPGSSDVLFIYLQGGGGCWTTESCVDQPSASHLDGFGLEQFGDSQLLLNVGPFARSHLANPLRNAHMVFVPYCTGDAHTGDAVTDYDGVEIHHKGYANMGHYLARIRATFPQVTKVVLAGGSAGGIGALYNGPRTQELFGSTPVHVIDDSGILLPPPYTPPALVQEYRVAWNLDATLPAGCPECATDLTKLYSHVASTNPRVGLVTMSHDIVAPFFMDITPAGYAEALGALAPTIDGLPNMHYFVDSGYGHVILTAGWHTRTAGGQSLSSWTSQLVNDDPSWSSVTD